MEMSRPLAVVGTTSITDADVTNAILALGPRGASYNNPQGRAAILDQLIEQALFLTDARKNMLEYDPAFKQQLARVKDDLLVQFAISKAVERASVTDAEIRAFYDEHPEQFAAQETVSASHILVDSEEEAQQLLQSIQSGEISFEDAAKQHSSCPSSQNGGDLGEFGRGQMVPEFDKALSLIHIYGIMIGRGDMGVEIPYEELPAVQKRLITKCRMIGKRVITATEMLESMIYNSRPTRAEISDVANAVYDGSSAIMLSGETAAGKHPVEALTVMAKIAEQTEKNINYKKRFLNTEFQTSEAVDAISHATCGMAIDIGAKAIVACTLSGMTARMISRFRSPVDILGITTSERTLRKLALSWGVDVYKRQDLHRRSAERRGLRRLPADHRPPRKRRPDRRR